MLLSKRMLEVAKMASKDVKRYTINGIKIEEDKKRVIATDGKKMIIIEDKRELKEEDFPEIQNFPKKDKSVNCIINVKDALTISKNIEKHNYIPILNNVKVLTNNKYLHTVATNLDSNRKHDALIIDGTFPAVDIVIPQKESCFTIKLDADLFSELLTQFRKNEKGERNDIKLEFYNKNEIVKITQETMDYKTTGFIMPLTN